MTARGKIPCSNPSATIAKAQKVVSLLDLGWTSLKSKSVLLDATRSAVDVAAVALWSLEAAVDRRKE